MKIYDISGRDEVIKTLELIRDFLSMKGLNDKVEFVNGIIELINTTLIEDLSLHDNFGIIVIDGIIDVYSFEHMKKRFSNIIKNSFFEISEYVSSFYIKIPLIPSELIPSDEFNEFVKGVVKDEE